MADAQDSPTAARRGPRALLTVIAGLSVVVAVTWAAGGLRARASGPATVKPGGIVDQGLFDVQVMDARAGRIKMSEFDPPANLLVVRMRVTDRGTQSYGVSSFLSGIAAEPRPGRYVSADIMRSQGDVQGEVTTSIHPRLPVTVEVVWDLGNATPPPAVTLVLRQWDYGQSFTTDTFYWSVTGQSPITAKVAVPVRTGATS